MRILQIHTSYREVGGEEAVIAAEAELLRSAGHEVVEWGRQNPTGALDAIRGLLQAPHNRGAAREVADAARRAQPDAVHVHNTWFATSPSIFPALSGAVEGPVVMTLHNFRLVCANGLLLRDGVPCELCVGTGPWKAVRYGCFRDSRALSIPAAATIAINRRRGSWTDNVDRFFALSEFARTKLIAGGLPAGKVDVKANFVPDPGPRTRPAAESNKLIYVGRVLPGKGLDTLLDGWERAAPSDLELVVAGDGPQLEELRARKLPGVSMLGRVDHKVVVDLMLEARALLFPSEFYENMPMTLLEAFSAGLPVMGSKHGSMTEILSPFGDEWLVPPSAAAVWAERLALLSDNAAVAAASATARSLWQELYGPERSLQLLEAAYRA